MNRQSQDVPIFIYTRISSILKGSIYGQINQNKIKDLDLETLSLKYTLCRSYSWPGLGFRKLSQSSQAEIWDRHGELVVKGFCQAVDEAGEGPALKRVLHRSNSYTIYFNLQSVAKHCEENSEEMFAQLPTVLLRSMRSPKWLRRPEQLA